jgi:hypothetical protein
MKVAAGLGGPAVIHLDRYVIGWDSRLPGTRDSERQGHWNCH